MSFYGRYLQCTLYLEKVEYQKKCFSGCEVLNPPPKLIAVRHKRYIKDIVSDVNFSIKQFRLVYSKQN